MTQGSPEPEHSITAEWDIDVAPTGRPGEVSGTVSARLKVHPAPKGTIGPDPEDTPDPR
jgi:hypothetical protein